MSAQDTGSAITGRGANGEYFHLAAVMRPGARPAISATIRISSFRCPRATGARAVIGWRRKAGATPAPPHRRTRHPPAKRGRGGEEPQAATGLPAPGLFARLLRAILLLVLLFLASESALHVRTPPSTIMLARWLTCSRSPAKPSRSRRSAAELRLHGDRLRRRTILSASGGGLARLRQVIESGGARGASTISMQTAKNVYLWPPPRSYIGKALEIPIAIWLDFLWSKPRIAGNLSQYRENGMEGVFGAEAARAALFQPLRRPISPAIRRRFWPPHSPLRKGAIPPPPRRGMRGLPSASLRTGR